MFAKHFASAAAVTVALCFGSAWAVGQEQIESSRSKTRIPVTTAVMTTGADHSATPITEVQWRRRYYRGSYGYPYRYYRSYPYYYSYSYPSYYSYSYPRYYSYGYSPYYSYYEPYYYSYRPYYRSYYYPRYYTGYGGGFSYYGPRIGASFFW